MEITRTIEALDLFAGTGWGVACQWLGIKENGVEIMPDAVATRAANGMATIYRDVWEGLWLTRFEFQARYGVIPLYIASPPCQTFSVAGKGAGRQALAEVLLAISERLYEDPRALLEFGERHDDKTALVLAPLAYIHRDRPRYVALEQVPSVLPVWEAYAEVMRSWGYSVDTAVLNTEQYGVPQTRRRAILVARLDGEARLPTPTHSRYYYHDPARRDPGVLPWVSMADALGWGRTDAPVHTITGGSGNGQERWASGGASARKKMDDAVGGPNWVPKRSLIVAAGNTKYVNRFDVEDVSTIQTYPTDGFVWCGNKTSKFLQIGNAVPPLFAAAILNTLLGVDNPSHIVVQ